MNKKKVLIILGIILLMIFVLFLVHTIRNYSIIRDLQNKISNYSNSTNYYTKFVTTDNKGTNITTRYYKKDNKQVVFLERNLNGEISKIAMYSTGEKTNTYTEAKDTKIAQLDSKITISINIYNQLETENKWQTFLGSIFCKIRRENYNGKECYVIEKFLTSGSENQEIYIQKDTGLLVKINENETRMEREYKFDNVEDSIFIEPDINQYTIKENN